MTIRATVDGVPKCTIDGPRSRMIIGDLLKLKGFDLTQDGLRSGAIAYPSTFVQQLAILYRAIGDDYWVRRHLLHKSPAACGCCTCSTLSHTLALSHVRTHPPTHPHHARARAHTHTHARAQRTHTHTHAHTHTHTRARTAQHR